MGLAQRVLGLRVSHKSAIKVGLQLPQGLPGAGSVARPQFFTANAWRPPSVLHQVDHSIGQPTQYVRWLHQSEEVRGQEGSASKIGVTVSEVTPIILSLFCLLEASHQLNPTFKGKRYPTAYRAGGGDYWGPCQKLPTTPRVKYLSKSHELFLVGDKSVSFRPESGLALIIELTSYLISHQVQGVQGWMQPKGLTEAEAWKATSTYKLSKGCVQEAVGCLWTRT